MPFEEAKPRLNELELNDVDETFWTVARANIERISDIKEWYRVVNGPVDPVIEDSDYIKTAADLLPANDWNENTWSEWTATLKEKTGRKGKQLFMPLRQALTGMNHGPEMPVLLPLIGYDKTKSRLTRSV